MIFFDIITTDNTATATDNDPLCDIVKQEVTAEELLRHLEARGVRREAGGAALARDVLRLADRDGTGSLTRKVWRQPEHKRTHARMLECHRRAHSRI